VEGSKGSCKLCNSALSTQINRLIESGKNEGQIKRAIREVDPEMTWARPTFYTHKDHITHPLVTQADAARRNPIVVPKTNRGALEMIRDVGMRKMAENPDIISPDHTLKAISIMEASKRPVENIFLVLAKLMQSNTKEESDEIIVGEYTVLEEEPNAGPA
jgi:hypothetical protein